MLTISLEDGDYYFFNVNKSTKTKLDYDVSFHYHVQRYSEQHCIIILKNKGGAGTQSVVNVWDGVTHPEHMQIQTTRAFISNPKESRKIGYPCQNLTPVYTLDEIFFSRRLFQYCSSVVVFVKCVVKRRLFNNKCLQYTPLQLIFPLYETCFKLIFTQDRQRVCLSQPISRYFRLNVQITI